MNPSVRLLPQLGEATCVIGARTCYDSFAKASPESDSALLRRLGKTGHTSIFEHSNFLCWVVLPQDSVLQMRLDPRCDFLEVTPHEGSTTRYWLSGNFWAWKSALTQRPEDDDPFSIYRAPVTVPLKGCIAAALKRLAPSVFSDLPDWRIEPGRANFVPMGVYPEDGPLPMTDDVIVRHTRLCFDITMSRGLSCHVHRHRSFSVSQRSQRYVDEGECECIFPPHIGVSASHHPAFAAAALEALAACDDLRQRGEKKEDARYLLPGAVATRQIISMNLLSLRHFLKLRALDHHTQAETRHIAQQMLRQAHDRYPSIFADLLQKLHSTPTLEVSFADR